MEPKPEYLLWLDLETTGLRPANCHIIEVAWVITKKSLAGARFDPPPFIPSSLVLWAPPEIDACWEAKALEMHKNSGLYELTQGGASHNISFVEGTIFEDLSGFALEPDSVIYLAGSSVHFDMGFLRLHMPELAKRLHYRLFDVTAQKLFFESLGYEFPESKDKPHRAAQDIINSFELYKSLTGLAPTKEQETAILEGLLSS